MLDAVPPPGFVSADRRFRTTEWGVIAAAGASDEPHATEAFGRIYRDYWYPVFAWFRERGRSPAESEDLAQQFFLHLLAHRTLGRADASQGRFRAFLRGALRRFDINECVRQKRQKRGGGFVAVPLDTAESEARFRTEFGVSKAETPDRAFDRRWGETVLLRAVRTLEREFTERRDRSTFEIAKAYLTVEVPRGGYAESAERLGISPNALAALVARMRRRFAGLVLEEVRRTVGDPSQAAEELRAVLGNLANTELGERSAGGHPLPGAQPQSPAGTSKPLAPSGVA